VHSEDNRVFDIFSTSGRLGVFGDRQSREVLLCRNCQGVSRKIPSTSLKLAGLSSGATSSCRAADEYICGLEKRSRVFVRNELQASFRIRTSQTVPRLIAECSLSTFRVPAIAAQVECETASARVVRSQSPDRTSQWMQRIPCRPKHLACPLWVRGTDSEKAMSALPPKADMCSAVVDVCFGPIADMSTLLLRGKITRLHYKNSQDGDARPRYFLKIGHVTIFNFFA
jgi:hypothetical protein